MLRSGTRLGHYEILSMLGAGGMGEVYRARDESLLRFAAVKVLSSRLVGERSRVARFQQEARAASALNHPHIIHVYEIGESLIDDEAIHYIAMELIDGETLREKLRARIDHERLIAWLAEVAQGVGKAHATGIVHRDLKPENIMITSDGYAKVLDFGLAKLMDVDGVSPPITADSPTAAALTRSGVMVGTPAYMSPEQIEGRIVDARADVFSLGCILYEGLGGKHPFAGDSTIDTMHRIVHEDPPQLGVPSALQQIIRRSTAKRKEDRYSSAADLAQDLREYARGATASNVSSVAPSRKAIAAAVAIVGIVIAAAAIILQQSSRSTPVGNAPQPSIRLVRLTYSGDLHGAKISPDGKYLVFIRQNEEQTSIVVRQLATSSEVVGSGPARNRHTHVVFSHDSDQVYFVQRDATNKDVSNLYRVPIVGGQPIRLITDIDSAPTLAPDGRIAFIRWSQPGKADSSAICAIVIADADGRNQQVLSERRQLAEFIQLAWSPDGKVIVAAGHSPMTRAQLLLVDAISGAVTPFKNEQLMSATWLPNGQGLVALRRSGPLTNQVSLFDYPSGQEHPLTNDTNDYSGLSITSDGNHLLTTMVEKSSSVWTIRVSAPGSLRQLTATRPGRRDGVGISWTRDGRLLYSSYTSANEIWLLNRDGSSPRKMIEFPLPRNRPVMAVVPSASPGSDTAAVFDADRRSLALLDLTDGGITPLTNHDADVDAHWSPDGRHLYFLHMSQVPSGYHYKNEAIFAFDTTTKSLNEFRYRGSRIDAAVVGVTDEHVYVVRTDRHGKNIMGIARDGSSQMTLPFPGNASGNRVALSPDEQEFLYQASDGNVWTYSIETRDTKPLTFFAGEKIAWFALSRDGELAFQRVAPDTIDAVRIDLVHPAR